MNLLPARYAPYPSRFDPPLRLYARFVAAGQRVPTVLRLHGWHGSAKDSHRDNVEPSEAGLFHEIEPDLRGRGDSTGRADANGWELQDAVDALAAGPEYLGPGHDPAATPLVWGGSGGGGNVLGILGKFPDLFATAVAECGISDYGLWFAEDAVGEFRDEMEGANWIGGTPRTRPEAYLSRGGRTTAANLLTPLLIVHGETDPRVPFEQATAYVAAARAHEKDHLVTCLSFPGVGHPGHFGGLDDAGHQRRRATIAAHLAAPRDPPALPAAGRLVVAGFLQTRRFRVELDSIDHVALLAYDLAQGRFDLRAPSARAATITLADEPAARPVACAPIRFDDLCAELRVPNPATYILR